MDIQFSLLTKILSFDRNLKTRCGDEIVIGIIYQSRYRTSLNTRDELETVIFNSDISTIEGLPLRITTFDVSTEIDLEAAILRDQIDIFYLMPLRAFDVRNIFTASRNHQIVTFTSVLSYVEDGATIGIELKGEKPHIVINLHSAKSEGADFNSRLLRLARVIQ
jgi:hypothetical protein